MPLTATHRLPLPERAAPARPAPGWLERWALRPAAPAGPLRRVFVVGCERSGTTVLQFELARRAGLLTVPETHFFAHLLGAADDWVDGDVAASRQRWLHRLAWLRTRPARPVRSALAALPQAGPAPHRFSGRGYTLDFFARLDTLAAQAGAAGWLEKTPGHFVYLEPMARLCPDARFVHIVRAGEDVVASAVDAELRHADHASFRGGPMHWVRRWNRAAETHLRWAGQPGHHVVFHDELVAAPERVLGGVLHFLGRDDAPPRPTAPGDLADLADEPWKRDALSGRIGAPERRFEALFGPEAQALVRARLRDYTRLRAEIRARQR